MSLPLVSVVVPSFNNESRVGPTLASVIAQDYENLEIIFVNDASTDNTLAIAENTLKDSGCVFKIINHETRRGVSVARNDGFDIATGDFVLFCDGDDMMKENQISVLVALIQKYDCEISFGGMIERYESGEPDVLVPLNFNISQPMKGEQAAYMRIATKGFTPHLCCTMFKKIFLEKIELRFTEGCLSGEDIEFSRKAFCRAEKVAFTPECLYIYVQHSGMGKVRDHDTQEKRWRSLQSSLDADVRTAEYLIKHAKSKKIKFLIANSYMPELAVKRFTMCARFNKSEEYSELLKDRELKKILCRSFKTFFFKPEVCLKAAMILLMPKLYYSMRKE
ncbi:MAG: glycosyltransferase family 2 protein [Synergistaceae bacterium]|nr:glycosyltransferase family 2 protein [Synergistaceae bacterium]